MHNIRYWDSVSTALGIFTLISASAVATYLQHYQPMHVCAFCNLIRYLLMTIGWLYLWKLLTRPAQWIYTTQLVISLVGFVLSLRQVSFQHSFKALSTCSTPKVHSLKAVWHWITSGAPGCHMTPVFGPFTLAGWACIAFGLLALLTGFQLYIRRRY
jgi:disulfide bond formation protein DsbB